MTDCLFGEGWGGVGRTLSSGGNTLPLSIGFYYNVYFNI